MLALLLALLAVLAAARAVVHVPARSPAERLLATLSRALIGWQRPDGSIDPFPQDLDVPLVRRTGPHALAALALARTRTSAAAGDVPGLEQAVDRALDVLVARQQPGGTFGGLPPSAQNPWPGIDATAAGLLAFAHGGRPQDRGALRAAAAALVRAGSYGLRDGWTRALGAIAIDATMRVRLLAEVGGDLGQLLPTGEVGRLDCGDYRLAEAVVRVVRGSGGPVAEGVLGACLAAPPAWEGPTSDVPAWWLQAWLAARLPGGEAWFEAALPALADAVGAPPAGWIGEGWFADEVSQTAAGVLCLLEGLASGAYPVGGPPGGP